MDIAGFSLIQLGVAIIATLIASFVRGVTGFGMAIVLVPVLALALMPLESVLLVNFLGLFIGLTEIRQFLAHAERSAWIISGLVLLATGPGLMALAATPPDIARLLIAMVALLAFGAIMLPTRAADAPGAVATGAVGISAGLLTGFAGMPGPPVVPYYVGRHIPRQVAKASMLLIFTVACVAGLGSGAALGVLGWQLLVLSLLLFPLVLLGNWAGTHTSGRVSDKAWRGFTGLVLGATALVAIIKLF
ncbi:sulfite exporter TauE/SafE family protein [Erythrobacter sp. SDW2]|uniref:sulfite exporter TauE/SafE family protein n=1 Tax=Erythrobacter sp. SDW2 TaxID=2907154 RepID=UPI001F3AC70F|nr:sulfite exporter TauE/SafE family protein [Erythrobacter sp. SDW2]UIP07199.1 sulfite exporter TauE/SafE family protein [Erythrobacter sp. SDW2]